MVLLFALKFQLLSAFTADESSQIEAYARFLVEVESKVSMLELESRVLSAGPGSAIASTDSRWRPSAAVCASPTEPRCRRRHRWQRRSRWRRQPKPWRSSTRWQISRNTQETTRSPTTAHCSCRDLSWRPESGAAQNVLVGHAQVLA